jgi:stearoyl-CoA desaturase (delta-9 desaturase)
MAGPGTGPRSARRLDWINIAVVGGAHLLAVVAIVYLALVHFSWGTIALALGWFAVCGLSITGGYHRLFAHRAYRAAWPLRATYLLFGAGAVQNSALRWSGDHRLHHTDTDAPRDPYNIQRGFWWAHIGWVFVKNPERADGSGVRDLAADPLVALQDRYYVALAILFGVLLPAGLGALWGDALGALLVAGFLRLVIQWHATFSINSFAHWFGRQPHGASTSARDSAWMALISFGEGYHNFHHRFQADYRNGVRWYHFDPTKWFVWSLGKLGATWDLRRTPREAIERDRRAASMQGA